MVKIYYKIGQISFLFLHKFALPLNVTINGSKACDPCRLRFSSNVFFLCWSDGMLISMTVSFTMKIFLKAFIFFNSDQSLTSWKYHKRRCNYPWGQFWFCCCSSYNRKIFILFTSIITITIRIRLKNKQIIRNCKLYWLYK